MACTEMAGCTQFTAGGGCWLTITVTDPIPVRFEVVSVAVMDKLYEPGVPIDPLITVVFPAAGSRESPDVPETADHE